MPRKSECSGFCMYKEKIKQMIWKSIRCSKNSTPVSLHDEISDKTTIQQSLDRTLVPEEALADVISWEQGASIQGYELIKILGQGGHGSFGVPKTIMASM